MAITLHTKKLVPYLKENQKLYAIKVLKEETNLPLKDCKEIVDELYERLKNEDIPAYIEYDGEPIGPVPIDDLPNSTANPIKRYDNTASRGKVIILLLILVAVIGIAAYFFNSK